MTDSEVAALRHRRVTELFLTIVDLDPAEREEALARACNGDLELRIEVNAMLAFDAERSSLLDSPVAGVPARSATTMVSVPERVGPYRLLERIGEGGMGVVHRAEQDSPRRIVAVKLLRPLSTSTDSATRFAREIAVLARLDHPSIARILESGVAKDGLWNDLPWYAMEFVPGAPIVAHADAARLDRDARIDLFLDVLDAVAHAHRNGVIHRDLKAANILVDRNGRPRVLDFGIARLRDEDAGTDETFTRPGTVLGTLECMSPEQAEGRDPDTRTDVFALGLLLHELLLGQKARRLDGLSWSEAIARVTSAEFPTISLAHAHLDADLAVVLAHALERDPEQRYDGAADFAADLRRWRAGEPILARPTSAWYRLRKWLGRHRLASALAAAVVVVFVAGFIATFLAWREAMRRERETQQARSVATAVDGYLTRSLLSSADPRRDGRDTRVVELLERASRGLDEAYPDDSELRASIRETLARSFSALTDCEAAEREARRAIELRTNHGGAPLDLLAAHFELASALIGQAKYPAALAESRLVASGRSALLGPNHESTLRARAYVEQCRFYSGEREEAANRLGELLAIAERDFGADSDLALRFANDASVMALALGRLDTAEQLARRCLESHVRRHGPDHSNSWFARGNLAEVLEARGKLSDAVSLHRELLSGAQRLYGDDSVAAARARVGLSSALAGEPASENQEEALELLSDAITTADRTTGPLHPIAIEARRERARQLSESGRHDEAATVAAQVVTNLRIRFAGQDHPDLAGAINTEARVAGRAKRFEDAARFAEESVAMFKRLSRGAPTPEFAQALYNCGRFLRDCGRIADAVPMLEEALAADVHIYGEAHVDVAYDRLALARTLVATGRPAEARTHLERAIATFERELGVEAEATKNARSLADSLPPGGG